MFSYIFVESLITKKIICSIRAIIFSIVRTSSVEVPDDGGTIIRIKAFSHHRPRAAVLWHYALYRFVNDRYLINPLRLKLSFVFRSFP